MLSLINDNVDTEKLQEFVLDEIQSDHEKWVLKHKFYFNNLMMSCLNFSCSDSELPLSSIGTSNNIDTKKW